MKQVTQQSLESALKKAQRTLLKDPSVVATSVSAGFVTPFPADGTKQKRGQASGVQVFVRLERYSDQTLKDHPDSGGLLSHVPTAAKKGVR